MALVLFLYHSQVMQISRESSPHKQTLTAGTFRPTKDKKAAVILATPTGGVTPEIPEMNRLRPESL